MKQLMNLLLISAGILFGACSGSGDNTGTTYYVDAIQGDDSATGLSEEKAWKSLDRLQELTLQPGDSLLLRRGSIFQGVLEITGEGTADRRVVVDAYGTGDKPCIQAPDGSRYAVQVKNSSYLTLQHLEVVNNGSERLAGRTGVKVLCDNYGTSHHLILNALYIHDVNGSLVKQEGGGSGILIENRGKEVISVFDSLTIENCVIRRCERNAMIWSGYWSRQNWHPSTNTLVRYNLIEEVPGDGIVPIGCENTLIEYNLMRNCPATLPQTEAAAGFWPWSCDNTTMQFNEVSDHKAPWDAQGFDSDYNCNNTTIQYNYSHDNEGGFVLICNSGSTDRRASVGNNGTVVQYNISINDATRTRPTRQGMFSPTIHVPGPSENTRVNNNILHVHPKSAADVDRSIITLDSWDGFANNTTFRENLFYVPQPSEIRLYESTNTLFTGNYYLGQYIGKPTDREGKSGSSYYASLLDEDADGFASLTPLFEEVTVGDGAAKIKVVKRDAVHALFERMKE
ncbi:right-handed parallel beta-helix repeat-containing protein [Parabacteroides sp. OttesenSCG-928-N08]|nr:right-handed parallel beta-helix repeat-containing protein [Parabacteroides sp. OttesenSCG-928-N08]